MITIKDDGKSDIRIEAKDGVLTIFLGEVVHTVCKAYTAPLSPSECLSLTELVEQEKEAPTPASAPNPNKSHPDTERKTIGPMGANQGAARARRAKALIEAYSTKHNLFQTEIAEKLGVTSSVVSRWGREDYGISEVNFAKVQTLCK